jgi:hypothetical protein
VPNQQFYTFINSFFDRTGTWWLNKSTLAIFACNREFPDNNACQIGMMGVTPELFKERCVVFGLGEPAFIGEQAQLKMVGVTVIVDLYQPARKGSISCNGETLRPEWIVCPQEVQDGYKHKNIFTIHGTCKLPIDEVQPYMFPIPYLTGLVLDTEWSMWFKEIVHRKQPETSDCFFTPERKQSGYELLQQMLDAAEEAGIRQYAYPGFGTMLGIVREGDFILHDRDLDFCFDADNVSVDQMDAYFNACDKRGMFEFRKRMPTRRADNHKYLWFSLGAKNPFTENGCKSCNWFCYRYGDYIYHSKGEGQWVDETKFKQKDVAWTTQDVDICKCFKYDPFSKFTTMDFHGIEINIPVMAGWCCDEMYPLFPIPRPNKSSAHTTSLIIRDWCEEKTWRFG